MGLSEPVQAAIDEAVALVEELIAREMESAAPHASRQPKRNREKEITDMESELSGRARTTAPSANDLRDLLLAVGGLALIVVGAGLVVSHPMVAALRRADGPERHGAGRRCRTSNAT